LTWILVNAVLEHFSYNVRLQSALKEWHRVLQPGGVLRISVPDIDVLAHLLLQQNPKTGIREYRFSIVQRFQIMRMMFGGHMDEHNVHLVGLNEDFLRHYLRETGFQIEDRVEIGGIQIGMFRPIRVDHTNCLQVAIKTHSCQHGLFKGTSEMIVAGTLISLNVNVFKVSAPVVGLNRLQRVPESASLHFGIRTLGKR
jgi:predicted SAM-dependent methyltransferase